ncbi:VC0807 family protein [Streptomyces sp. NPDC021096]|uniref:VC0807 family protein n=1 Tax=Streptomyces sp. NPDC021096 TaxID=3154792 RepID=UPI0033E4074E
MDTSAPHTDTPPPDTPAAAHGSRPARALLIPLTVTIVLPMVLYYALRAQGVAQWQALLLSGAIPAAHALAAAVVRRRAEFFDLFVVALLAVSAVTSLISGNPRVLLLKDAGLPALLGVWILATLFFSRPFTFHFGGRLRGPAAAEEAERAWRDRPEFREALRGLTVLWGCFQLLDAFLSTVAALVLPIDVVPVTGRFLSYGLLAAVAVITVRRSRRFRARHGIALFGARTAAG